MSGIKKLKNLFVSDQDEHLSNQVAEGSKSENVSVTGSDLETLQAITGSVLTTPIPTPIPTPTPTKPRPVTCTEDCMDSLACGALYTVAMWNLDKDLLG